MTDSTDNWSRDISTELEELNAFLRRVVETLPLEERFYVTSNWRKNYSVVANSDMAGLFQTNVSLRDSEEAIFAYGYSGKEKRHCWIPDAVDTISVSGSGISVFRNAIPLAEYHEHMYFAALNHNGKLKEFGDEFIDFVIESKGDLATYHIGSLQYPAPDSPGLLVFRKWPQERPKEESWLAVVVYGTSESGLSVLRQSMQTTNHLMAQRNCYLINNVIVAAVHEECGTVDLSFYKLEEFIKSGDLDCVASYPVTLYDDDNDRVEDVVGADNEYVYVLNYVTGILRRIRVER